MRAKIITAAVLVQFLVLAWMAGEREWITRTGPTVWLRTAPVDPRDIFRGDFVRLGYEISTIPAEKFGPGLKKYLEAWDERRKDTAYGDSREIVLYAALDVDPGSGVADIAVADLAPPPTGPFIKGRVRPFGNDARAALSGVAYGIDAYFVQQGKGRELERGAPDGVPDGVLVPMEMQVALGSNGTAVLVAHRWNALGIGVRIDGTRPRNASAPVDAAAMPASRKSILHVTLFNAGDAPLAVVMPPDLRTLRIQRLDGWNGPGADACPPRGNLPSLTDADVRLLQPGASTSADIDTTRPEWFVRSGPDAPLLPLGHADAGYASYRIVYQAPSADDCRGLKEAARIVPGQLAGRQFSTYEFRE